MTLLCKQKALYVKCCIIQNGVADFHEDVLDSTDIKKIFTSFNNQNSFEIYHDEIPIQEVSLLENYISQTEETIAGTTVPIGSWNAVIRVDNPTIQTKLLNNDFGGVSLNNRVKTECSAGLNGMVSYSDLRDAECVIPVYISFVEEPANLVGLHIMDYNVYIQKSKHKENGGKEMSLLEDLKALVSKAESEAETLTETAETESVEIAKEAEEEKEEEPAVEEEEEEKPQIEKEAESEAESEAEVTDEEPVIEKEAEEIEEEVEEPTNLEDEVAMLKEEIANIKEIIKDLAPQNPIDQPVEEANPNEPIITKSAKIEVTNDVSVGADFYEMTGRDRLTGKKIRKETKILN